MANTMNLHLCVNCQHTGTFVGLLREIHLDDCESLTLESPWCDRHLKIAIFNRLFQLGLSRRFVHFGRWCHVGTYAWDVLRVTPSTAAAVLNFCVHKGYRPSVAEVGVYHKIERGELLKADDLVALEARGGK